MKTLSSALAAHLASGATTMAYCWRLTRRDATVLGFTEHDADLVYAGTTFKAATGFTASRITQDLGLTVDNMSASGALSSLSITETDILAGRYDDATVELFWVNWADTTQGITVAKGNLGEIQRQGLAFVAEFRSLASRLNQNIGGMYRHSCSATLGDSKCRVDLTNPALLGNLICQNAGLLREFSVAGLSSFASDWFTAGVLKMTSGANSGLSFEVKSHLRTSGVDYLDLWNAAPFAFAIGDTGMITAGCRKTFNVCRIKFGNQANFRGFPHIPGNDHVTSTATRTTPGLNGGSLLGN